MLNFLGLAHRICSACSAVNRTTLLTWTKINADDSIVISSLSSVMLHQPDNEKLLPLAAASPK